MAVDGLGRQVAQRTVAARTPQHLELVAWARTIADERVWAVEDCRHVSRRLERDLLAVGERIVRVPPKLMAGTRTSVRARASPIRSTRWRWRGPRRANRTYPKLGWMSRPGS